MKREAQMRIGILGGTFDPIHFGHLLLAEQAREQLKLGKIIFIPSFISPFKKEFASPAYRYKMVCLALSHNPFFKASLLEIKKGDVSYSIETVRKLKKKYTRFASVRLGEPKTRREARREQDELFFILGSDSWSQFSSWKDSDKLLDLIKFAVIERKGFPLKESSSMVRVLGETLPVSSSQIRERIKQNMSIRYLVPEEVRKYIFKKGLYK